MVNTRLQMIKFFNLTILLIKVKMHDNSKYNNIVDKLAKDTLSKNPTFIDPRLLIKALNRLVQCSFFQFK